MDVCGECQDGYAPIQGSPRCFAGFSGRVLVTEGLSTDGNTVYDPNGVIIKIYGDTSDDVKANAVLGGATFSTDQAPGVAAFGGALDGEWPGLVICALQPVVGSVLRVWHGCGLFLLPSMGALPAAPVA